MCSNATLLSVFFLYKFVLNPCNLSSREGFLASLECLIGYSSHITLPFFYLVTSPVDCYYGISSYFIRDILCVSTNSWSTIFTRISNVELWISLPGITEMLVSVYAMTFSVVSKWICHLVGRNICINALYEIRKAFAIIRDW